MYQLTSNCIKEDTIKTLIK